LAFAQTWNDYKYQFLPEAKLIEQNVLNNFSKLDFSKIWFESNKFNVIGIIGEDNERLKIRLISITQNPNNPKEYLVKGKSKVKSNVCDFSGNIIIETIYKYDGLYLGVDEMYKDSSIQSQGVLIAKYSFQEDTSQNHSGIFKGELYSKWFLDANDNLRYDRIDGFSDSYTNNSFIGTWQLYDSKTKKKSCWSDFRVPCASQDFDNGAGEFSPSLKYDNKGWKNYRDAFFYRIEEAIKKENEKWWEE